MTDAAFLQKMQELYPKCVKIGKVTGQVRLTGKAWDALRLVVWARDMGKCVDCGKPVTPDKMEWGSMHAAHIKSKGAGHNDLPSNMLCKCLECHQKAHSTGVHTRPASRA